jgi:hypothetical protein
VFIEELTQSKGSNIIFQGHSHQHMDVIHEDEMSNESHFNDEDGNNVSQTNSKTPTEGLKINVNNPDTPVSTIKGLLLSSKSDQTFSKNELRKADEQISKALKAFYNKLRLLKRYR